MTVDGTRIRHALDSGGTSWSEAARKTAVREFTSTMEAHQRSVRKLHWCRRQFRIRRQSRRRALFDACYCCPPGSLRLIMNSGRQNFSSDLLQSQKMTGSVHHDQPFDD
jgi:hypothetical protein